MKITDTHVYFYSANQCFSNWHKCEFKDILDKKVTFYNSEQAFMWYKADFFHDILIRDRIEKTKDPRQAKELGRAIKNYDDLIWSIHRLSKMTIVNILKFEQNEEFRKELLDTGDRILVEASPYDTIWGVGLMEDDPLILDEKNWKGTNLLGVSLMDVRRLIR